MRKKIVVGNWKMNMTSEETKNFLNAFKQNINIKKCDTAFAVPYTSMTIAKEVLEDTNIGLAAQNMHYEPRGAYTGEISAEMLKDIGIKYCIIGHSERRKYFNETDEIVNKKVKTAVENGILPIVCVGETLEEREERDHLDVVRTQVKKAIADIDPRFVDSIIIAYEPLWAIGTGNTATKEQAEDMCSFIRYIVAESYGMSISENIRVIYGGSVNESNAKDLFDMPNIDGALVGGASLKQSFVGVVNAAQE